eukprot:PRCOL_00003647-RA
MAVVRLGNGLGLGAGAGLGAAVGLILVFGVTVGGSIAYKDQLTAALDAFTALLASQGLALGLLEYAAVYIALELLAVPAIPLTMSAGALFGTPLGLAVASFSSTTAATLSFLFARTIGRERVLKMMEGNRKLQAVDEAVGRDGFRVVALLRLSPLLPFALSNYVYGVSSVGLPAYVAASWLGMLPGTLWFVGAGSLGRSVLAEGASAGAGAGAAALAASFALSVLSAGYVGKLVSDAVKSVDDEEATLS